MGKLLTFGGYLCALAVTLGCGATDGQNGADGENGLTGLLASREATNSECEAGGNVISLGLDSDRDGDLATDEVDDEIVVCSGEAGADGIDGVDGIDGIDGVDGINGANGQNGANGMDGQDADPSIGVIEGTLFCGAAIDVTGFSFAYSVADFTDGSVWSAGYIDNGAASFSGSSFYDPTQTGAATAPVFVVLDGVGASNGGFWAIELNRVTLVVTITYSDAVDAVSPTVYVLPAASNGCVVNGQPQ